MNSLRFNGGRNGFTLVELLVALAIGSVVMAGTVQMFRSQRTAFELLNQMKLVEENGRVAMDMMARERRKAGGGGVPLLPVDNTDATYAARQTALGAKAGTDILEVFSSMLREPICVSTGPGQPGYDVNSANAKAYQQSLVGLPGWYIGISDAEAGALLGQYTVLIYAPNCPGTNNCTQDITENNSGSPSGWAQIGYSRGVNNDGANRPHDCDPVVVNCPSGSAVTNVCFNIGSDYYYYVNTSNELVRRPLGGNAEVLASYVEDFQITYGQDANNDNVIQSGEWTNGSTDPSQVRMVKISLLLKNTKVDQNKTPELAPILENSTVALGAADRYRKRVFTRTVRLRNMEVN
jgi:type IV pilus assembly protein PilW